MGNPQLVINDHASDQRKPSPRPRQLATWSSVYTVLLQTGTGRLVTGTLTGTVPFTATLLKVVLDRVGRVSPSFDTAAARKLDFEFLMGLTSKNPPC
jgi:hypothetical protein